MQPCSKTERGFTLIEVMIAAVISMVGLIFLASLFTLSISQNRMNKQFQATTALAQQKLEELNAIDFSDSRISVGGDLFATDTVGANEYFDEVYLDDQAGTTYVGDNIPDDRQANYRRFWRVENDPELLNTLIISTRVVAVQPGHNTGNPEETTLTTVRSY
jgi:prepilin-type N-terminal cleavage/methylation domain-containing protein